MDCRTTPAVEFRKRLGFKQHDPIMTQEQSILTKLGTYFKTEDELFQHSVLGYRIYLYVPKHYFQKMWTLHKNIKSGIERQNKIENELGCKFIRIDPSREKFDIIDEFCKIKNYISKSTKKGTKNSTTDQISDRLLSLEFKSNNSIKTKCF